MTTHPAISRLLCALGLAVVLLPAGACAARGPDQTSEARPADAVLRSWVERVLASALDVNADTLTVEASEGVVTVGGRVVSGFEQQSVGAIVRAVPGVTRVRFDLQVDNPGAGR
ncbi:MAG: BON domain-containing protein [Vicinamibacterales bacterium]|nr:BON domain-containing protein [Vicinamibacterales bacterium]